MVLEATLGSLLTDHRVWTAWAVLGTLARRLAVYWYSGRRQIARDSIWRQGFRPVAHCYSGCGVGKVLGDAEPRDPRPAAPRGKYFDSGSVSRHMTGDGGSRPEPVRSMDPIYGDPTSTREWYDSASAMYARFAEDLEFPPTGEAIDALDLQGDERVLDVGCGAGRAVAEVAETLDGGGQVLGIDFAPGMCRESRATLEDARVGDRAGIVCGDVTDLPIATDSVDIALSSFVLDLLSPTDIDAALTEMRRVLVPDGRIAVVSLAAGDSIPTRLYRAIRTLFPQRMDCRPIPLVALLERGGYAVTDSWTHSLYGLPVTVAVARL